MKTLSAVNKQKNCEVQEVRRLTDTTSIIRFERQGLSFDPGQYIRVGIEGDPEIRDYSIYSGVDEDFLEVLVRRVEDGLVSKQLVELEPGARVAMGGPYGHFKLTDSVLTSPLLFVATGTGVSPFHSFIYSHADLNYRMVHGTSYAHENYEAESYGERYFHCVSREEGGDFQGRVTDYLHTLDVDPATNAFLCGNCDMIYEAFDLLQEKGLPTAHIHTEVYF
jgi:ferredoxin--NADP+ reductase